MFIKGGGLLSIDKTITADLKPTTHHFGVADVQTDIKRTK